MAKSQKAFRKEREHRVHPVQYVQRGRDTQLMGQWPLVDSSLQERLYVGTTWLQQTRLCTALARYRYLRNSF